jgi:[CysO sulfur-carrier protein]-S-L-cysteine hydrolase
VNLLVAAGLLESVIEHAKANYPRESCGLLAGRGSATRFIPMDNIRASSSEYEMDPARLISVLRDLRGTGEQLVAIYHSHPHGPARLSNSDIARAYYPEAAHLIVSLADLERPQVAGFRIVDGEAIEIEVHAIV